MESSIGTSATSYLRRNGTDYVKALSKERMSTLAEKKAFVFDTNFIIQNRNLDDVYNKLMEMGFVVYVPQVAIDERIAQTCLQQKGIYDKLEALRKDTRDFAKIDITRSYEETEKRYRKGMQKRYEDLFGIHIIPYDDNREMFKRILHRAYMKIPPFITQGTDKGFKDSLMWLSLMDYFVRSGEESVVFVSSDNGFKENASRLCQEFARVTGKSIEIKDNSYYKELLEPKHVPAETVKQEKVPNIEQLRERILNVIDALRGVEVEDYWGNTEWTRTFATSKLLDADYVAVMFSGLKRDVDEHIFDRSVPACEVLALDDRISNGNVGIPIEALEHALELYEEINQIYPELMKQFCSAAANILNANYVAPEEEVDDGDLPF